MPRRHHYDRPSREYYREDERRHHHEPEAEEFVYNVELPEEFEEFLNKKLAATLPDPFLGEIEDEPPEPERILTKEKRIDPEALKKKDVRRY